MGCLFFKRLRNARVDASARRIEEHEIRWKNSRQSVFNSRANCTRRRAESVCRPCSSIGVELDRGYADSKVAQGYCSVTRAGVGVNCIPWFINSRAIDDGDRPPRTSSMIRWRYSSGYGRRDFGIVHSCHPKGVRVHETGATSRSGKAD